MANIDIDTVLAGNETGQKSKSCFSEGKKPPETIIRRKINEEYDGNVVKTSSGNMLHVPSKHDGDNSICNITKKAKSATGTKLEYHPRGTKEFCNPCMARLFPERSNK